MSVFDGFRSAVNSHRAATSVAIMVVIVAAGVAILRSGKATGLLVDRPLRESYYDEQLKEVEAVEPGHVPPLTVSDGHELVRIHFVPGDPNNTIQYLEKFTPAERARLEEKASKLPAGERSAFVHAATTGLLVRAPADNSPWVPADSREGKALMQAP